MSEGLTALTVGIYGIGCMTSFFLNLCKVSDGHQLLGRIFLWPLFLLKGALIVARTAALDLAGWLA
jgi:hypothetical protein